MDRLAPVPAQGDDLAVAGDHGIVLDGGAACQLAGRTAVRRHLPDVAVIDVALV
jgi:hypothetical protein